MIVVIVGGSFVGVVVVIMRPSIREYPGYDRVRKRAVHTLLIQTTIRNAGIVSLQKL